MDPQQFGKGEKSEGMYRLLSVWFLSSFSLEADKGLQEMLDQKKTILAQCVNSPLWMFACRMHCGQFLCYPKYNTWVKDSRAVDFFGKHRSAASG